MGWTSDSKQCPWCLAQVPAAALKCQSCGEFLEVADAQQHAQSLRPNKSPGIAALLSFLIPGAGQMYQERVLSGLVWFVVVILGYTMFILPGLFLHLCCIFLATNETRTRSRRFL